MEIRGLRFTHKSIRLMGGEHSGHHGHAGRPGSVGGSAPGGGGHIGRYVPTMEGRQDRRKGKEGYFESKIVVPLAFRHNIYNELKYMEGGPEEYANAGGISRSRADVQARMTWARDAGLIEKTGRDYELTPLGKAVAEKSISDYRGHIALMIGDPTMTSSLSAEAISYWTYANWPKNTSRVRFENISQAWEKTTRGAFGRIQTRMVQAEQLTVKGRSALVWENIADLNQVGLNPGLNREDFLG